MAYIIEKPMIKSSFDLKIISFDIDNVKLGSPKIAVTLKDKYSQLKMCRKEITFRFEFYDIKNSLLLKMKK